MKLLVRSVLENWIYSRILARMPSLQNQPKTVLIYRSDLLPVSETFVLAQANTMTRFLPRFAGLRRVRPGLEIPANAVVATQGDGIIDTIRRNTYKLTGFAPGFIRKVQELNAQLIHAHFATDGVFAMPLARKIGIPLIVTLHGFDATIFDSEHARSAAGRLYLRRRAKLWDEAALFLCVSDFILNKALEAGFPANKLRRHYIGINQKEFFRPTQDAECDSILFIGRLVEKKGCELLIRAVGLLKERRPKVKLTIVGDGFLRGMLENLAKSLEVDCKFLGSCSSNEVRNLLQRSTLLCSPSITARNGDSEGLPIVILEAQAMGVPVVSFRHGGIAETVIHGETGLLAPEGDYEMLAEHLLRVLEDNDLRTRLSNRSVEWISRNFNLEKRTRELEDIYEDVLSGDSVLGHRATAAAKH